MDAEFVRDRITALRISQGLSEYALSRQLGQNKSYINKISSGKALPSMDVFFEICEFFEITPKMFFDEEQSDPIEMQKLIELASNLTPSQLELLISIAMEMNKK